jgi:hypothetical protein
VPGIAVVVELGIAQAISTESVAARATSTMSEVETEASTRFAAMAVATGTVVGAAVMRAVVVANIEVGKSSRDIASTITHTGLKNRRRLS